MTSLDEQLIGDLMRRSTGDLHASAALAGQVTARQRRRTTRHRITGLVATGAAAGTAFGVIAATGGTAATGGVRTTPGAGIRLTAAQQTLSHLSSVAATASPLTGRYVVMTATQDGNVDRTTVIDQQTGDIWTYQKGAGLQPVLPVARHDSPTSAQFAAMPTDPAALRTLLISQFWQQQRQADSFFERQARKAGKAIPKPKVASKITGDDIVFDQATDMLWNPLVGPDLRSALFKVLEDTPGVVVDSSATDPHGRPAIEISRVDSYGEKTAVFENPSTAAMLADTFTSTSQSQANGSGWSGSDVYLSVTSTNTAPTASQYGASQDGA
jgi:hypothetical protein